MIFYHIVTWISGHNNQKLQLESLRTHSFIFQDAVDLFLLLNFGLGINDEEIITWTMN